MPVGIVVPLLRALVTTAISIGVLSCGPSSDVIKSVSTKGLICGEETWNQKIVKKKKLVFKITKVVLNNQTPKLIYLLFYFQFVVIV